MEERLYRVIRSGSECFASAAVVVEAELEEEGDCMFAPATVTGGWNDIGGCNVLSALVNFVIET